MSLGIEWTLESCYPTNSSELLGRAGTVYGCYFGLHEILELYFFISRMVPFCTHRVLLFFMLLFSISNLGSYRVYVHCSHVWFGISNVNPGILQSLCTLQPCLIWNFPCQSWDPAEFMYIAAMFDLEFPMSILGSCRVYVHCSHVWFVLSHVNPAILQSLCTLQPVADPGGGQSGHGPPHFNLVIEFGPPPLKKIKMVLKNVLNIHTLIMMINFTYIIQ